MKLHTIFCKGPALMQFCGLRKICVVTLLEDLIYTQEFPSPLDQFRYYPIQVLRFGKLVFYEIS